MNVVRRTILERVLGRLSRLRIDVPHYLVQLPRIILYRGLSDCRRVNGRLLRIQPVLLAGRGRMSFGKEVVLGVRPSPGLYSTYSHIEARTTDASVDIGDDVWINNNACLMSEGPGIRIGAGCRIGPNFTCIDSDFHEIPLGASAPIRMSAVMIGARVFVGSNVTILRGVSIGDGCVIAAGAVVSRSMPPWSLVAGNPARLVRSLTPTGIGSATGAQTP